MTTQCKVKENDELIVEIFKKIKQLEKYEETIKELQKQVQELLWKGSQENWKEKELWKANKEAVDF